MTKAELRKAYTEVRGKWAAGEMFTNEYALHLEELLSGYLGLPSAPYPEDAD